ncbi:hypothetical protein [Photobacterium damselae]|uniref:hypothetical protein n=1 Tax=Photobacterium damselae TaxID=38293 RepID=UPI004068D419
MKFASLKIEYPSDVFNVLSLLRAFDLGLVSFDDGNEYEQLENIFKDLCVTIEISDDTSYSNLLSGMLVATNSEPKWKTLQKFVDSFKPNKCLFLA